MSYSGTSLVCFVVLVLFASGCEEAEPLKEGKIQRAIKQFEAESELNDVQKILLFEYIVNRNTFLSYEELRKKYGNVQPLVEGKIVSVQSRFNEGKLSLYVNTAAVGGRVSIHGIILKEERLKELARTVKKSLQKSRAGEALPRKVR